MNEKLLLVKTGSMKAADKARVRKLGIVVVEVDYLTDAKFLEPGVELEAPAGELLAAAARAALRAGTSAFGEEIAKVLAAKKAPRK